MSRRFDVLFTKDGGKKRKVFHDGKLVVTLKTAATLPADDRNLGSDGVDGDGLKGSYSVILYDNDQKELHRKILTKEQIKNYEVGNEIIFHQYILQIENENSNSDEFPSSTTSKNSSEPMKPADESLVVMNKTKFLPKYSTKKSFSQSAGNNLNISPSSIPLQIDPSLLRVMREHQIEAANFILNCFSPTTPSQTLTTTDDDDDFYNSPKSSLNTALMRGAILADDMGLGKTLTAISVLWAYLKGGKCKGLIICPSSLVENWEKEIRKWMGVRIKPLCLKSGPQATATVNTFRVGHPNMTPVLHELLLLFDISQVLILSYEMFRKHSVSLNATPLLDIMICDEAHRLKNVTGTKTMTALSSCKATKRLVLTGTPIQNRLSELYAILQFICPDTSQIGLGSLSAFKHLISDPIDRYNRAHSSGDTNIHPALVEAADKAKEHLTTIIQKVMIRRSREEILKKLLPPRKEYILKCSLTESQKALYQQISDVMKDEWEKDVGRETSSYLLPGLQKLRQICNYCLDSFVSEENEIPCEENFEDEEFNYDETINRKRRFVACFPQSQDHNPRLESKIQRILSGSSKLQLLDSLIQTVSDRRSMNPQGDYGKIVVVSNFTSMLDIIEALANFRNWSTLRLDGSVLSDKRMSLVDRFNRSNDPSLIFLLSSKAGGVGLNLIGANRLVMVDCDWNPAVDAQAMARIWREGQQRPVYVYRLIAADKIEEAIYQRQRVKEGLHSVLSIEDKPSTTAEKEDIYDRDDEVEEEEENAANFEEQEDEDIAPWLADIWSLVWPSGPSRDSPPISMLPTGYDDDLLNTISQTSQQILMSILPIQS